MGTSIQNIPTIQRIVQTDGINNKSYESSPSKVFLGEGNSRQAKIENSINSGENRMDLFINTGGGITAQSGIVQQIGTQSLYLTNNDNSTGKAINLVNNAGSDARLTYANTVDAHPFEISSQNTDLKLSAPSTAGSGSNIEIAPAGSLVFTGSSLQASSSTGSSGQYLVITLNGTQ